MCRVPCIEGRHIERRGVFGVIFFPDRESNAVLRRIQANISRSGKLWDCKCKGLRKYPVRDIFLAEWCIFLNVEPRRYKLSVRSR